MLHSQLKTKYPDCPFLEDNNDNIQFEEEELESSLLIEEVVKKLIDNGDDQMSEQVKDFLSQYVEPDSKFIDKVEWKKIKQPLSLMDSKRNLHINFHTTAYKDEYGNLINRDFEGDVGWLMIQLSLSDSINVVVTKSTNFTIHDVSKLSKPTESNILSKNKMIPNENEVSRFLDPTTYKEQIDNQFEKFEANIISSRLSARRFMIRDPNKSSTSVKKDMIVDTSDPVIRSTNTLMEHRSTVGQIDLKNNTRASATVIRERLANPYKAYRLRTNPELYEKSKKVDSCIRNVSEHIVNEHNKNYRSLERDIERYDFDYVLEKIGIKKINGIYRFFPNITGKITINGRIVDRTVNNDPLCLLTVMRYKKNIHITLHELA